MKFKPTLIITIVLALVLAVSLTVFASLNSSDSNADKNTSDPSESSDISQTKSKTFTTSDGAKTELKLKDNQAFADDGEVSYTDGVGGTYVFDSKGNLASVRFSIYEDDTLSTVKNDPSLRIKEDEARNAAVSFGKNMLGEKFDKYNSVKCQQDDSTASYLFSFKMRFGENGFIGGPACKISVLYDGNIEAMYVNDNELYDEVDVSILEGITEREVWDFADKVIEDTCTTETEFTSITHTSAYLEEVNGEYVIIAEVKLCSKVDLKNKLEGKIFVDTSNASVWKTETYNGPGALNVLVIYPLS